MEAFLKGLERSSWRLLSVSPRALEIGASLLGKSTTWRKLSDSLQVDSSLFKTTTGWKQRVGTVEGLYRTAVEYRMMNGFFVKTRPLFVLRVIDIFTASFGLVLGLPVLLLIYLIGFFDTGSPLFFQERVGRSKQPFILVKFRTMRLGTASVASHLANKDSVTPFGSFLRRTKLDELPQLWNVLKGDMSLVGPRPGLFNQGELLAARDRFDIYSVRPGITGLAQVSGIDMSTPELLAQTDAKMISELNLSSYFRYVKQTIFGAGRGDAVKR
jgi:lipopolysaccharide/colanic/teichoic acid biosynthesis glycosyltransferase